MRSVYATRFLSQSCCDRGRVHVSLIDDLFDDIVAFITQYLTGPNVSRVLGGTNSAIISLQAT